MESIIILAGDQNVGKTTTLREFAEGLLLDGNTNPVYGATIAAFFNKHVRVLANGKSVNQDLWLIVPTKKGYVYVATKGDDPKHTSANAAFFRQDYMAFKKVLPQAKIYTFDMSGNDVEVKADIMNYYPYKCFSGARPTKSVTKPLLDCAKEKSYIGEGLIISMRAKSTGTLNRLRIDRYKNVLNKLF